MAIVTLAAHAQISGFNFPAVSNRKQATKTVSKWAFTPSEEYVCLKRFAC